MMFERILVPLDGSPRAELILAQLANILRRQDSEVLLTRALLRDPGDTPGELSRATRELRDEAKNYLLALAQRLVREGVRARICHSEGPLPESLLDAARTEKATLIAMTTHGKTGLARWMPGTIAERIARTSDVPVLLVPSFPRNREGDPKPATAKEIPLRKILVPVDGSAVSRAVVPAAIEFARLFEAEVSVLCVTTPDVLPTQPAAHPGEGTLKSPLIDALLVPVVQAFRDAGIKATPVTLDGDPASQIVDYSAAMEADLIAMATHGRSGLTRWLLGSVAERVLRSGGVPLLLVRPQK